MYGPHLYTVETDKVISIAYANSLLVQENQDIKSALAAATAATEDIEEYYEEGDEE